MSDPSRSTKSAFEQAARSKQSGIVGEFVQFANENRKWWIVPLTMILIAIGLLLALAGTAAAPFIYTLF